MTALCLPLTVQANERIVLNSANTVIMRGPISGASATAVQMELVKQVLKRGAKKYPIYLVLDSPGGSIEAGFMFVEFAKHIPNLHTISIFSASMASAIVESLSGDRLVTKNGTLMFHKAYAGIEGTVETGSLESFLSYIKKRVRALESTNAARMNLSLPKYKSLIANELWLDAEDSLRLKAADRAVDVVCTGELINATTQLNIMSLFGAVKMKFSGCPLFRVPFSVSEDKFEYKYGADAIHLQK